MRDSARLRLRGAVQRLRARASRIQGPGLGPVWWVIAVFLGVMLGRTARSVAAAPTPPLTGSHGAVLGVGVAVAFVALVALVATVIASRR